MNNINQIIRSISGHYDRHCYEILQLAVQITAESPHRPLMKDLIQQVATLMDKPMTTKAIARALERAAADVWTYGCRSNLERIFNRPLIEPPTAKSLVFALAEYCNDTVHSTVSLSNEKLQILLQLLTK